MGTENKRLIGIKAIADYLNISERNVYRWEKELGLPLRRIGGSKGRYVYADAEELDKWLKQRNSMQEEFRKSGRRITSWIVLFLGLFAAAVLFMISLKKLTDSSNDDSVNPGQDFPNPISASIDGKIVSIKGENGQKIWNFIGKDKDMDIEALNKYKLICFFDFDNDHTNEVITRIYCQEEDKFYLILFDNDGSELWRRDIRNEQEFNEIRFQSDFFPLQIDIAYLRSRETRIITYWRHRVRFLSLISCHDREGRLLNKFVHTGNLGTLETYDLDQDGDDEIIFAGTNNLLNGEGIVGVLCSTDFKGVSPPYRIEPEYNDFRYWLSSYVPDNPEHGNQRTYIRFKKTNHLTQYLRTYVFASLDNIETGLIHVWLVPWEMEFEEKGFGFQFVFDSGFHLKDVIPDAAMLSVFPILKKNREIDISLEALIKIYSENVLRWQNGHWVSVSR